MGIKDMLSQHRRQKLDHDNSTQLEAWGRAAAQDLLNRHQLDQCLACGKPMSNSDRSGIYTCFSCGFVGAFHDPGCVNVKPALPQVWNQLIRWHNWLRLRGRAVALVTLVSGAKR